MLALVRISSDCVHGKLKDWHTETITTDLSLSPFDGDELTKILDLIGQLQGERKVSYDG
jgi:hypothetical protein